MTLHSMTGFGVGSAALREGTVFVEIRSLNHRFVDVRVRVPSELGEHAFYMEQSLRNRLDRGRFDVTVRTEGATAGVSQIDMNRARAAYAALCQLRDDLAPGSRVPISVLTSLPELFTPPSLGVDDQIRSALDLAVARALERMNEMRAREGNTLRRELHELLSQANALCKNIQARSAGAAQAQRLRLKERIERLLSEIPVEIDPGRLESEVAFLADKSDIAEELARLRCHFEEFGRLLESTGPVGRRLDFLLQEIARESNTVGAKSADAPVSHLIVELKSVIERMREQVQNVE